MEHSNNINDSVKRCLLATVCRFRDKSGSYYMSEALSLEDAPVWMGRDAHAHSTEHSWRGPCERRALPSPPAFKGGERWLGLCLRGWLHLGVKVALEPGFAGPEELRIYKRIRVGWREGNSKCWRGRKGGISRERICNELEYALVGRKLDLNEFKSIVLCIFSQYFFEKVKCIWLVSWPHPEPQGKPP